MTGVQQLHDRNITGKGIVIGIVDTGIVSSHPALQGKILSIYDVCNSKPLESGSHDSVGHGTFCASVAVGNSTDMIGVAPDAKVRMYSIGECMSYDNDDDGEEKGMVGVMRAYDDKVDVISCSFGSDLPFSQSPMSLLASRVAKTIPIVFSASNSGDNGMYTGQDGASGDLSIAVGSFESDQLISWNATINSSSGKSLNFRYLTSKGWVLQTNSSYLIQHLENLCDESAYLEDGRGKFLVGQRKNCSYLFPIVLAFEANFTGILVEAVADVSYPLKYKKSDMMALTSEDLLTWIQSQGNNETFSILFNMNQRYSIEARNLPLGLMARSSSWGPTFEQGFYPHVSAPGGKVLGASNTNDFYEIESGTSFACPYVAGLIALYLSGHKNATSKQVRNALISTAKLTVNSYVHDNFGSDNYTILDTKYAPFLQQGNGLIDLVAFYDATTFVLSEPYLNLNDTDHRISDHSITIQNIGNDSVSYSVNHYSMDVVYARNTTGTITEVPPKFLAVDNNITLTLKEFSLEPGKSITFNVSIKAPEGLDESLAPIFSGFVKITDSRNNEYRIPYVGMEFSTQNWSALNNSMTLMDPKAITSDKRDTAAEDAIIENPVITCSLDFGSPIVSFDLVEENYNQLSFAYPPVKGDNGYLGPLKVFDIKHNASNSFPITFVAPIALTGFYIEGFANKTLIPDGTYRLLARSLDVFGNKSNSEDWSLELSEAFNLSFQSSNSTSSNSTSQLDSSSTRSKGLASTLNTSSFLVTLWLAVFGLL